MQRVPVYEPELTESDAMAAADAVRSGWISSAGPALRAFEERWASYCGMPHAVAVSNGTSALELALDALRMQPGDEVVCPTFTIVSCVRAIVLAGGTPVLVDADRDTFNLDLQQVESKVGSRTRAILAVHTYGHPFDAERLRSIATAAGRSAGRAVDIVEDAAEAHGAEANVEGRWQRCGSLGDLSVFSFYGNKPITTGEGGMLLTRDESVAERARWKANLCFGRDERFRHTELGGNFRLTNVQAAIGLSQLSRIEATLTQKRRVASAYRARLSTVEGIRLQKHAEYARPIDWMFGVVLDDRGSKNRPSALDARELGRRLNRRGVESRPFFLGMHEQPAFRARGLFQGERHPVSEMLSRRGLYLPSSPGLEEATIDCVCDALRDALNDRS